MIHRSLSNNLPSWSANKTLPPEFNPLTTGGFFVSRSVRSRDVTAIGDSMTALNSLPCRMLSFSFGGFFRWMPADGSGVKNDLCLLIHQFLVFEYDKLSYKEFLLELVHFVILENIVPLFLSFFSLRVLLR